MYFITSLSSQFRTVAFQKMFSQGGVLPTLVTRNENHFIVQTVMDWLNAARDCHTLTPPCHPRSDGFAKNFIKTMNSASARTSTVSYFESQSLWIILT